MKCKKCAGRLFLDRVFSDNMSFETFCILCGDRKFVKKDSELGKWLQKQETARLAAGALAD